MSVHCSLRQRSRGVMSGKAELVANRLCLGFVNASGMPVMGPGRT